MTPVVLHQGVFDAAAAALERLRAEAAAEGVVITHVAAYGLGGACAGPANVVTGWPVGWARFPALCVRWAALLDAPHADAVGALLAWLLSGPGVGGWAWPALGAFDDYRLAWGSVADGSHVDDDQAAHDARIFWVHAARQAALGHGGSNAHAWIAMRWMLCALDAIPCPPVLRLGLPLPLP